MNESHVNVWRHSLVLTRRSPAFYSLVEATCNRIKTIFLEFRITSKSNLTAKIVIFTLKCQRSPIYEKFCAQKWYTRKWYTQKPKILHSKTLNRLHRLWWRILETKCVGDNFEMLVTVLAVSVNNIRYLLTEASGTNNQKMSPISKFWSLTSNNCHQDKVTNIHLSPTSI